MQPTPRNKLYMTREDFPSYNDEIARVYRQLHPKEEDKEDDMLCKDVTFCVTEACNLACTYCYECHKTSRRMSWETAKRIVDGLFAGEFVDNTAPAIILDFIGGEPLTWKSSSSTKRSNILSARRFPFATPGLTTT